MEASKKRINLYRETEKKQTEAVAGSFCALLAVAEGVPERKNERKPGKGKKSLSQDSPFPASSSLLLRCKLIPLLVFIFLSLFVPWRKTSATF